MPVCFPPPPPRDESEPCPCWGIVCGQNSESDWLMADSGCHPWRVSLSVSSPQLKVLLSLLGEKTLFVYGRCDGSRRQLLLKTGETSLLSCLCLSSVPHPSTVSIWCNQIIIESIFRFKCTLCCLCECVRVFMGIVECDNFALLCSQWRQDNK